MPEAGQHLIVGAQILIDGLGFGGGFDDENVHTGCFSDLWGAYLGSRSRTTRQGTAEQGLFR